MRSPFPGMDPYLEPRWHGLHLMLAVQIAAELNRTLPDDLRASVEESLRIESAWPRYRRTVFPDVAVHEPTRAGGRQTAAAMTSAVTAARPVRVAYENDPLKLRHVVISGVRDDERIVTVIELLSPDVKRRGDPRRQYLRKLRDYFRAGTNVVEYNLLRRGAMPLTLDVDNGRDRRRPYVIRVHRVEDREAADVYPFSLREPIPPISVPLRRDDVDVVLHVQPLLDRAYREGRFDAIDYGQPADPPLSPDDAAWLATLLAARAV